MRVLCYTLVALAVTWPLALAPGAQLAAWHGPGDPYLNLWALGWNLQQLTEQPRAVLDGRVFDARIFHPAAGTLAYSDHLILQALLVWPIYALGGGIVLCYNALFVGSLVLAALAMDAYVRQVTGSPWGARAAGLAWGFWPYHFAHQSHLQLQALYLLPLTFLFLHRLVAGQRRRDALALGVTMGLQGASALYYGVIGAIGVGVAAIVLAGTTGRGRGLGRLVRRGALALLTALLVWTPFLLPYRRVSAGEGFGRTLAEASRHAATAASYLRVPPVNWLYGGTGWLRADGGPEDALFVGFLVMALAVVGSSREVWRGGRVLPSTMGALALTGFVLSLGPDGVRPLYAWCYRMVPGFEAIRAPARFAVLGAFGAITLAAVGVRDLLGAVRPARLRQVLGGAMLGAIGLEYANVPHPYVAAPPLVTPVGQWLRQAAAPGAVVHVPVLLDVESTPPMLQALEHRRPLVNGYSGQRPSFYTALADVLNRFPAEEALRTLHDLGVRYVVTSAPVDVTGRRLVERARLLRGPPGWGGVIYELTGRPPDAPAAAAPPAPGAVPFRVGEVARYAVEWVGMGGGVAAGTARLVVEAPGPRERAAGGVYRFVLTAATAGWVARFYTLDDRFETVADTLLRPLWHARRVREGRRAASQAARYDHLHRRVEIGPAGAAATLALPLAVGARDPLAVLYYARSLGLTAGSRLALPLNDMGRAYALDLTAVGIEPIETAGARQTALRIEPRLRGGLAARRPLEMTVWLSLDARRIPLAAEVSTSFGRVRAELVEYRAGR